MGRSKHLKQMRRDQREAAEIALWLDAWYERFAIPADAATRYDALLEWGNDPVAARDEIRQLAQQLGMEHPDIDLVPDAEMGANEHGMVWSAARGALLFDARWWKARLGWERMLAAAVEVFHAYQGEMIARLERGDLRPEDPPAETVRVWASRTPADMYDPMSPTEIARLRNVQRYFSHPYEADALAFARTYLDHRTTSAAVSETAA